MTDKRRNYLKLLATRAESFYSSLRLWEETKGFYYPDASPAVIMIRDLMAKRQWECVESNLEVLKKYIHDLEVNEHLNWENINESE